MVESTSIAIRQRIEQTLTSSQLPLQDIRVSRLLESGQQARVTIEVPVNMTTAFSLRDAMSNHFSSTSACVVLAFLHGLVILAVQFLMLFPRVPKI